MKTADTHWHVGNCEKALVCYPDEQHPPTTHRWLWGGGKYKKKFFFFPSDGSFPTKLISPINLVEKLPLWRKPRCYNIRSIKACNSAKVTTSLKICKHLNFYFLLFPIQFSFRIFLRKCPWLARLLLSLAIVLAKHLQAMPQSCLLNHSQDKNKTSCYTDMSCWPEHFSMLLIFIANTIWKTRMYYEKYCNLLLFFFSYLMYTEYRYVVWSKFPSQSLMTLMKLHLINTNTWEEEGHA